MPLSHRAALLAICLIWAGNFLAAAVAVQALEAMTFTALRAAVVLVLLLPFLKPPARGQWLNLLTACWCMGALHFGLVFIALERSADISSIAILMQVYVPMSTLLAVLLLGERIGWRSTSAIALAFGGVLVVGLDPLVLAQLDVLGLVLASAFFLALGTIFMRRLSGVNVFGFQAWNALLSFVPLALLALATESPLTTIARIPISDPVWLALGYSAIGASIIGHGTFYWLVQRHEIQKVTPFLLLVPVLAVLLGMLAWGDRPGPRLLIGGALVILGVLWVTLRSRARQRLDGPAPAGDRAT
ncbi:DMT family transporter [Wenzhouxiangella sp. XN79A]|uniref:DMT family transporter n=1 Tax=Wenzhouxiangella sp. XN79A TaxID=2724193 RepID=UPI00144A8326|nr:DMT family transporter [Wenzhouxiangella sp. XN79A]NKI33659.1 DMT family transporter [Wenzhouxiangella sp. XN79A]